MKVEIEAVKVHMTLQMKACNMQMSELRKSVSTNSNSVVQIEDKVAQVKRAMEEMEEREREREGCD